MSEPDSSMAAGETRLGRFVQQLTHEIDRGSPNEQDFMDRIASAMRDLVARDDWLDERHSVADPDRYQQYLLHRDPANRFSVVSFIWGPGQHTPIHDHGVWGVVGMLRGAEISQSFTWRDAELIGGSAQVLIPGDVMTFTPVSGDVHRVRNAFADRISISIHAYGADIGTIERHAFGEDGTVKSFVSGYSN
jgi:predicted metal-dependent enzyme (double-stranded beta helix superfamily)